MSRISRTCPDCGFTNSYRSAALADAYFARHSCDTQRRAPAAARARAERAAGGPRRDCQHPGHPHEHGTRIAYQKDHRKCLECRGANAAASRDRDRDLTYGRWSPLVDADLVRAQVEQLRATGLGRARIGAGRDQPPPARCDHQRGEGPPAGTRGARLAPGVAGPPARARPHQPAPGVVH